MNTVRTLSDLILIKKKGGKGYGWGYGGEGRKKGGRVRGVGKG